MCVKEWEMLDVLGRAVCQAGLEKLAPDGTVDARETGEPLPHGGHPALELPHRALHAHSEPSGPAPPDPPAACPRKLRFHCALRPLCSWLRREKLWAGVFVRALYI